MSWFLELDAWVSATIFGALMVVGWWVGVRVGARQAAPADGVPASTRVEDATLALFGLLLAFSFAAAAERYDRRQEHVLQDATAIGDLATVAAVLDDPERTELLRELHLYAEHQLRFGRTRFDDPAMPAVLEGGRAAHTRMTALVRRAVDSNNTPTVHAPLVNALAALTTAHDARLHAARGHVPETILLMLVVLGVFTTFTLGRLRDRDGSARATALRIASYISLVSLVFAVTIDLQQARRGLMRVSQAPMEDVVKSLRPAESSP